MLAGCLMLMLAPGCAACGARVSSAAVPRRAGQPSAYVANSGSGTVTPIRLADGKAGQPIIVAPGPEQVLISPDGATAYVAGQRDRGIWPGPATLTVIGTASNTMIKIMTMCPAASGDIPKMAVTPDGKTLYYLCPSANRVILVRTAALTAGPAVNAGPYPDAIAITPDGKTAYVANAGSTTVTPIATATGTPGTPIRVGLGPDAIAITPDGDAAYVVTTTGKVVSIATATNSPGRPIRVPGAITVAITPDGATAYVLSKPSPDSEQGAVVPVRVATNTPGTPIRAGLSPEQIVITPDGQMAYVTNLGSGTVTPIRVAAGTAGAAIKVGKAPAHLAVTPDSATVYVVNSNFYGLRFRSGRLIRLPGSVTPIRVATGTPGKPVTVGIAPLGIAIDP